jgi:excisionase family DNA binding protein
MHSTNYEELLPQAILFNLKEIDELSLIRVPMIKKLINNGKLEFVKIGNKIHITRPELIRFLEANTVAPKAD